MIEFKKPSSFHSAIEFRSYLHSIGAEYDLVDEPYSGSESAYCQPLEYTSVLSGQTRKLANRWAILPMEGWDCLSNGAPGEYTERRWQRFGLSGASVLFGCEATAVMYEGKANTRQMMINQETAPLLNLLREKTLRTHQQQFGTDSRPLIGLQLTHSGRFCKPNDDKKLESRTAYSHPLLDKKFHCGPKNVLTDGEVENIIEHFIIAGQLAQEAGFDFVDVKQAHGYLGHEFLTAHSRPGKYGGSFENRTRFFRSIVEGIKKAAPGLDIAIRLSLGDLFPFEKGEDGVGRPMAFDGEYPFAFGGDGTGLGIDLQETIKFIDLAYSLGIRMIGATMGSPYYNPHIQRPAAFAVADGYLPPEEPLLGVNRQIMAVAEAKKRFPNILFIGSGYTYLQEFLPRVGEWVLRQNMADMIGIGRMVLSYPEIGVDSMAGKPLQTKKICRTFGECTNAPRNGMISGCFPLDDFYKVMPEAQILKEIKARNKK